MQILSKASDVYLWYIIYIKTEYFNTIITYKYKNTSLREYEKEILKRPNTGIFFTL